MAEVLNYATDLTFMKGGHGMFFMEYDDYEYVPGHLMRKITDKANRVHEEK